MTDPLDISGMETVRMCVPAAATSDVLDCGDELVTVAVPAQLEEEEVSIP